MGQQWPPRHRPSWLAAAGAAQNLAAVAKNLAAAARIRAAPPPESPATQSYSVFAGHFQIG
jgi:hypothetical protein